MNARTDALVAAADTVTAIRRLPTNLGERTVATVGSLSVSPDSIHVVSGKVTMAWDVRDPDDEVVERVRTRRYGSPESSDSEPRTSERNPRGVGGASGRQSSIGSNARGWTRGNLFKCVG